MLEEFVTLAELSYVRKTNFRVNLMSMAVKNIFLMLADPRCISAAPTARTFLSSPVLGPGGVQKIQGAPLWCCRGCFFLCVALLFTGPWCQSLSLGELNYYSHCRGKHFVLNHCSKYFIPYPLPLCGCCCCCDKKHNGCSS